MSRTEEELCLYRHSCQQMLVGPVSTSAMFNFSLNRLNLQKKKSELSSKCMQLLAINLCCFLNQCSSSSTQPAAAWTSSETKGVCAAWGAAPAKLRLSLRHAWCSPPPYHLSSALHQWQEVIRLRGFHLEALCSILPFVGNM